MLDRRQACLTTLAAAAAARAGVSASGSRQPELRPGPGFEAFEIEDLKAQRAEKNRSYLSFLERPTLSTGLYELPAGSRDGQNPHDRDEVYYVLKGRAKFVAEGDDGREVKVQEGTVLFVAAHVPHRFFDIEEDLSILVFFAAKADANP